MDPARSEDPTGGEDSARPEVGDAIAQAARRSGLGAVADGEPFDGRALLRTMGGVRGILEAVVPGIAFVVLYTITAELVLSLVASVGLAVAFTVARVLGRTPVIQAVGGLLGVVVSAALALFTGRAVDNFVPGLVTNLIYGLVFLVSVLVRWPLIGVAAGYLMGDGTAWRGDRRKRRLFGVLTLAWAGLFLLRLAVQYPLYLAQDTTALGTWKLVLGLPLYAPLLVLTVLAVRAEYRVAAERADAGDTPDHA
ncbi:DUF3159 domain-containing protein [Rathayibacter rathayi]|uniref:DUF3159 domain-containing protein n=1 Tax=Rathayibacter rathayi TaxID=33887 RepID=A0ABX5AF09_RATRA|nr:DUF3159 domain-containing protein [Rathayibacter rathayi]PPG70918.1 DUF3159 domain-containing protein [Rathayibacter rathayi]PPG77837.1 DUF3159 domain-containing protein [Rathayibacter rathayi]PPG89259.1 DUF3159 domain-containing protein [Rathayibacter rathayi]PPG98464.1 DUF3159 domain-containing protein [Rathayibacter rathayi]PPH25740.1 DUF3159 domain-containing protein [Rathayibacter rathayi]